MVALNKQYALSTRETGEKSSFDLKEIVKKNLEEIRKND